MGPLLAAGLTAGAGFLKGLFGRKAKNAQDREDRRALIAALNLRQKQSEDSRRGRLSLGRSILSGIPATTAGGRINTNINLDPAILDQLGQERTYDFASTVPEAGKGGVSAFLSGLFGGIENTIPYMAGRNSYNGSGGDIVGIPVTSGTPATGTFGADTEGAPALSIEDLMAMMNRGNA